MNAVAPTPTFATGHPAPPFRLSEAAPPVSSDTAALIAVLPVDYCEQSVADHQLKTTHKDMTKTGTCRNMAACCIQFSWVRGYGIHEMMMTAPMAPRRNVQPFTRSARGTRRQRPSLSGGGRLMRRSRACTLATSRLLHQGN